jgi:rubredoxin
MCGFEKEVHMAKNNSAIETWMCTMCDYIYDPAVGDPGAGVKPKTPFARLDANWVCPDCGAKKDDFVPYAEGEEEEEL